MFVNTGTFLYLTFFYSAEAIIIMPSPRNHSLDFLHLAAALSGNGQSAKSKFLTTSTSLVPKLKIQNSAAVATEISFLIFASYHYFFNTKIQNSAAAAAEF